MHAHDLYQVRMWSSLVLGVSGLESLLTIIEKNISDCSVQSPISHELSECHIIVNVAIYFEGGMDKRLHGKSLVWMRTDSLMNFTKEAVI